MSFAENEPILFQFKMIKQNIDKSEELFQILCNLAQIKRNKCCKKELNMKTFDFLAGNNLHEKIANFITSQPGLE